MTNQQTLHVIGVRRATRTQLMLCAVALTWLACGAGTTLAASPATHDGGDAAATAIVINNVLIFDGVGDGLRPGNLLIVGRTIKQVSADAISLPPHARVIDGGGRVLMPGLTDAHWHMTMAANVPQNLQEPDLGLMYANTVAEAHRTLLRGFTMVRDMGDPTFGIKEAIDAGIIPGPRVYPSGALISQTAGHGDFAPAYDLPKVLGGPASRLEEVGQFTVADGVPEVLGAVRGELKKGASQIKLAASGGVASDFDPIDSVQFTPEELRAAVRAASDWGTYVAVHVYSSAAIRRALDAGVLSIEHGHLADEATVRLIAEKGAWLSIQPFEPGDEALAPKNLVKAEGIIGGWEPVPRWAKKYHVKVAFGTDLLFNPAGTRKENLMLTRMARVYSNVEVLKIATSGNCELFARSGPRNPYKEAKLGVIQEGAWADVLLVDGDPTKDINVLADPQRNFVVIIKDGTVYKNTLH
jgi:imidazolonepropionase-like amidohydrolase